MCDIYSPSSLRSIYLLEMCKKEIALNNILGGGGRENHSFHKKYRYVWFYSYLIYRRSKDTTLQVKTNKNMWLTLTDIHRNITLNYHQCIGNAFDLLLQHNAYNAVISLSRATETSTSLANLPPNPSL